MFTRTTAFQWIALTVASLGLAACSNGGELTLESGAKKVTALGSPYVQINQGGKALIIESGKTASTGVHGWVSIQSVSAQTLKGPDNTTAIINKSKAFE